MTSLMYKDIRQMEVTDDPAGRAELLKHGWSEKKPVKKRPTQKTADVVVAEVVADDDGE